MEAKARRQLTIAARAIGSAGIIASFGLVFFDNKARSSQNYGRRHAFVERCWRAASPGTPGQEISDLMLPEAAVKTSLKKRPQTRGLRSNGGNP